jgi:uncharacterized membrane protein YuzA (DUF378 family)
MDYEIEAIVWIVAAVGALNWGLVEVADMNIVTQVIGSANAGLVYLAIGAAGALVLADKAGVVEIEELVG